MVLIDADIICYRCGFASERNKYYVNGEQVEDKRAANKLMAELDEAGIPNELHTEHVLEPVENCLQMVKSSIEGILDSCEYFGPDYKLFLTAEGGNNFRNEVATIKEYKGNRKDAKKPHWYTEIREYLVDRWGAEVVDGQEADDAIGIAAWSMYEEAPDSFVIASIDKDLDMIPGTHFNWVKNEFYYVNDLDAMRNFYMQLLTGDTTDNIPGIKGIGPVKAKAIIGELKTEIAMYDDVYDLYCDSYIDEYDADNVMKEIGRLLWIRREPDEMWKPFKYEVK